MKKTINISVAILIFATIFIISSCQKEDYGKPELPPAFSMQIDTNNFKTQTKNLKTIDNWFYSAANVGIWNAFLMVSLAVPTAVFHEAFNHEPVKISLNKWQWKYNVNVGLDIYTVRLVGTVSKTEVNWEMYVSKFLGFQNFRWYTGVSKIDGTSGSWTINRGPFQDHKLVQINWNYDATTSTGDVKFENIETGSVDLGSYIHFGTNTGTTYDAFYDINLTKDPTTVYIEWHRTNKNGHVKSFKKYGNNDWHCWDGTLQDAICN